MSVAKPVRHAWKWSRDENNRWMCFRDMPSEIIQILRPPQNSTVSRHYDKLAMKELSQQCAQISSSSQTHNPSASPHKRARREYATTHPRSRKACSQVAAFNNWVTSSLASLACRKFYQRHTHRPRVLDIAGGKGSGLNKFHHDGVIPSRYVIWDISRTSLECARIRFKKSALERHGCIFDRACVDVLQHDHSLQAIRAASGLPHIIHFQFAVNYMCDSTQSLDRLAERLSACASRGTILILTFLNGDSIMPETQWKESNTTATATIADGTHHTPKPSTPLFQNELCSIRAHDTHDNAYVFRLSDAVQDCTEFIFRPHTFSALMAYHGWQEHLFVDDNTKHANLWKKAASGKRKPPVLNAASQSVCALYGSFVFEFRRDNSPTCRESTTVFRATRSIHGGCGLDLRRRRMNISFADAIRAAASVFHHVQTQHIRSVVCDASADCIELLALALVFPRVHIKRASKERHASRANWSWLCRFYPPRITRRVTLDPCVEKHVRITGAFCDSSATSEIRVPKAYREGEVVFVGVWLPCYMHEEFALFLPSVPRGTYVPFSKPCRICLYNMVQASRDT